MQSREHVRVAVIGGGAVGASIAYHLACLGWTDVALIERGELASGTTWHAAGLTGLMTDSPLLARIRRDAIDSYPGLDAETGGSVGFRRVGGLHLARSQEQVDALRYYATCAQAMDLEFDLLDAAATTRLYPLLRPEGVMAAGYMPGEGHVDPSGLTQALAKGASGRGVKVFRNTRVRGISLEHGEWSLRTDRGEITAEYVVNAAGQWANEIAALVGARLPIVALEHQHFVTTPIPEIQAASRELPLLTDPDLNLYVRQEGEGLLVGAYEANPRPWALAGIPPDFGQELLPPALERIDHQLEIAATRIPVLASAGIKDVVNGPDAYTPDGRFVLGPMPSARNFYVATGYSSRGIALSFGSGRLLAEWIVQGTPTQDLWEVDSRRFSSYATVPGYVVEKAADVYATFQGIHYPVEEREVARPVKTDPIYDRLAARGAVFGARNGWEAPIWFAPRGVERRDEGSYRLPSWFPHVLMECEAVRAGVGVLDQSIFAKYLVIGDDAAPYLDRLLATRLPSTDGRVAYGVMLTDAGTIQAEFTVARLRPNEYYLVAASSAQVHHLDWLDTHIPPGADVTVRDVTSQWGVLTLAGPRSRNLLARVSDADWSNEASPYLSSRDVAIGAVSARAMRLSFSGELGWELHHPIEYLRVLYDRLMSAGADLGIIDFGIRALAWMSMEKGFPAWPESLSTADSPIEAGLRRFLALDKEDFVGRGPVVASLDEEPARRLVTLVVDTQDRLVHRNNPVLSKGSVLSRLVAAGFGPSIGKPIGFAYLPTESAEVGTELELVCLGDTFRTVVSSTIYDPGNARMKA